MIDWVYQNIFKNNYYTKIKREYSKNKNDDKYINIYCSDICNYSCSYCHTRNNTLKNSSILNKLNSITNKKKKNKLLKAFNINIKEIKDNYIFNTNNSKYLSDIVKQLNLDKPNIILSGCEPTMNKNIDDTINSIYNVLGNNVRYYMLTNGSQSIEYYYNLHQKFPFLGLTFSYHPEFVDNNHFIDIVNLIDDCNIDGRIKLIIFSDDYFESTQKFVYSLSDEQRLKYIKPTLNQMLKYNWLLNTKFKSFLDSNDYAVNKYIFEFDDNNTIEMNESDTVLLGSLGIFKNFKCSILYKEFVIMNNIIKLYCSNNRFNLETETYKFIDYYKEHKFTICPNDRCTTCCFLESEKIK